MGCVATPKIICFKRNKLNVVDGDEMNLMLVLDTYMFERLRRLEAHHYALDLEAPRKISGYLSMPAPVVATATNWLYEDIDYDSLPPSNFPHNRLIA